MPFEKDLPTLVSNRLAFAFVTDYKRAIQLPSGPATNQIPAGSLNLDL